MKSIYFTLLMAVLFSLPSLANNVIVSGYVTYSNGAAAANQPVFIQTDSISSPAGCHQYKQVFTNANGYYVDSLSCTSGNIVKIKIQVIDCNWTSLTYDPQVPLSNSIMKNFVLSCNQQQTCTANFTHSIQGNYVSFSSVSTTAANNQIVAWHWNLGDGMSFSGMPGGFVHQYTAAGNYNVKLRIETANGCKDSITKVVTIANTTGTCQAQLRDSALFSNHFMFLSGASTADTGTYIISRYWSFGDGNSSTHNSANIAYTYQQPGTYNVCLRIITSNGCRDSICKTITVTSVSTVTCNAGFTFQAGSNGTVYFNNTSTSNSSGAAQYHWNFGNGQTSSQKNPIVTYTTPGTYNVCMVGMFVNGCVDTVCKNIIVPDTTPLPSCNANFNYQVGPGGNVYFNNSSSSTDSSFQYLWKVNNNIFSTTKNASYQFQPGTYNVCLLISSSNCADSICKTIVIPPPATSTNCEAVFGFSTLPASSSGYAVQFNSENSHGSNAPYDTIVNRTWYWGDGQQTFNVVKPVHVFTTPGTYNVCLVITSANGCKDTTCKTVTVPTPNQLNCKSQFTYRNLPYTTPPNRVVEFNSSTSSAGFGDSIVSRTWTFGDGSTTTNNSAVITHNYLQPGTYTVCLKIKTALNCERTDCKVIVVTNTNSACVPHFAWQKSAPKQIIFNSSMSWVPVNDTIVERKWNFGNATPVLSGNIVSPVQQYTHNGVYTVSLTIKTARNCQQTFTTPVMVQDTIPYQPNAEPVKIISIFPNPAAAQTQTIVWSQHNNVQAELAIYDVYGYKKWSLNKTLMQGNNITVVPTSLLLPGPYYFRVTTVYGVKSKGFFKR